MARQLTQQGSNAMERSDWKRAESLLQRAVTTSPNDPDARRHYADALSHRGAHKEALAQLEEARKLSPDDPGLTVRTGEVSLLLGQTDYANRMVDEALRLDTKFAAAWALRGKIATANGQPRQALADYQRSLGYAPDDHDVHLLMAEAYRQLNEPQRALVALQTVADAYEPGSEPQQVLYLEGLALKALGRYDDAARVLTQAVQRERPSADLLCGLAEAEMLAGRTGHAQYALQQALALDPKHAGSLALSSRVAVTIPDGRMVR